jgi:hypothetical protein
MDFVVGLPTTKKGHDYFFVVVERFIKMHILIPCKKTIKGQEAKNMFFEKVWVHFGIPRRIISDKDTRFISSFWSTLWEEMDTKLNICTTFHQQRDGQIEVVNMNLVQFLKGYNQNNPNTLPKNLIYIQNSYNIIVYTSISKSPFETCFGHFLPSHLDVVYVQQGGVRE